MTRIVFAAAALAAGVGLLGDAQHGLAQAHDPGPAESGSILRDPLAPPPVSPEAAPMAPRSYVESLAGGSPSPHSALAAKLAALAPSKLGSMNDAIKISSAQGPFVIYLQSYTGEDCHQLARQM